MKKKLIKKIDEISEQYESMKAARTLIHLIPIGIGSAIDSYFGNRASEIRIKRLEKLLAEIKEIAEKLDEEKIDRDYLNSEEFLFFWQNIFFKVLQTRDIEKIILFRNIFFAGISIEKPSPYILDTIIEITRVLETQDMKLLQYLKKENKLDLETYQHPTDNKGTTNKRELEKIEKIAKSLGFESIDLLIVSALKLKNHGLINTSVIGIGLGVPVKGDVYSLSKFGEAFIYAVIDPPLLQHKPK